MQVVRERKMNKRKELKERTTDRGIERNIKINKEEIRRETQKEMKKKEIMMEVEHYERGRKKEKQTEIVIR